MKKIIVLLLFFGSAACFITAGLRMNRQEWGMLEQQETKSNVSPELLSDIDMASYVSLPASFANIDIVENLDDISVTEDNVDDVMYGQLLSSASHLGTVERDGIMLVMNYTITQGHEVKDVQSDYWIGYNSKSSQYDETVHEALFGVSPGTPVHMEGVFFKGVSDAIVDLTITDIYEMPYPVTDKYIKDKTEYSSVSDMRAELLNDANGEAKAMARQQTISGLIDSMLEQTTFVRLPESLVVKELEVLQAENPTATYDDAKYSLRRIFFIAAVIKNYDIAESADMDKRYENLPESEKSGLDEYSAERKKYLLYEEDVVTCIYRKINISES